MNSSFWPLIIINLLTGQMAIPATLFNISCVEKIYLSPASNTHKDKEMLKDIVEDKRGKMSHVGNIFKRYCFSKEKNRPSHEK